MTNTQDKIKRYIFIIIAILAVICIIYYLTSNYYMPKCSRNVARQYCSNIGRELYGFGILSDGSLLLDCVKDNVIDYDSVKLNNQKCNLFKLPWRISHS